ncbi:MAG: hypothetical protein DCF18_11900 [Cyanobium sp.]|nr:MAG: hypothetical protein DCF18_11900 [Cyanobium sp.]
MPRPFLLLLLAPPLLWLMEGLQRGPWMLLLVPLLLRRLQGQWLPRRQLQWWPQRWIRPPQPIRRLQQ